VKATFSRARLLMDMILAARNLRFDVLEIVKIESLLVFNVFGLLYVLKLTF
jgi:hypothetical protein